MDDLTPDAAGAMVYPVRLFFDDGGANWRQQPIAATSIPEDLSIANPPVDPITNKPIDGREIREAFINESGDTTRFNKWGTYLYKLLFQGAVSTEWKRLHGLYPGEVEEKSEGLRTILDIKPDQLRWLPWELIYEAPAPLFFDSTNPFSRGTLENIVKPPNFMWPIHVLVIVGSRENDDKVNAKEELEAIEYAFIKSPLPIDWQVRCRPTKAELIDLIAKYKPQIFHFIGHGKEEEGSSFLELSDKTGGPTAEEWMVDDVGIDLKWRPRLAFLNACRSSSSAEQKNAWDIARAFSNAGVPAVIGMQADIKSEAAAEFSRQLYLSLLGGLPLDSALAEARAAVKNLKSITLKRRDWALATLYLQQLPEQILAMTPPIDTDTAKNFKDDNTLKKTHDFVGRRKQRRRLWHGVDQIIDRDDEFGNACIVVGHTQMGKTALVQASMKICALRQRQVRYIDIDYQSVKTFIDVLNSIRTGDPGASNIICAPLPKAPFAAFEQEHSALLANPNAVTILAGDNNLCDQFFTAYRNALIEIAATAPLILVLDHLGVEWVTFNLVLVPKLLLPIAQGQVPNCRLVLVCTRQEFNDHITDELKAAARRVDVEAWTPEKYIPLVRQICLYNNIKLEDVEGMIVETSKSVKSDWAPTKLREVLPVLRWFSKE